MSKLGDDLKAQATTSQDLLEHWISGLSETDRKDLLAYAADGRLTHLAFHEVVKSHGCKAGLKKLIKWRKANGFNS